MRFSIGIFNLASYFVFSQFDNVVPSLLQSSAVYFAAKKGLVDTIGHLLNIGLDIDSLGEDGQTPLMIAAISGNIDVFELLLQRGASVTAKTITDNQTVAHLVVRYDKDNIMKLLLDKKVLLSLEDKDSNGNTALNLATSLGREMMAKMLIESGADIESRNRFGRTPLLSACANGYLDIVKLLVKNKADVMATSGLNEYGNTAIHLAVYYDHDEIVRYLIKEYPSFISLKNSVGETPLYLSSVFGRDVIVEQLLQQDTTITKEEGPHGLTPLMVAASFNNLDLVKQLVNPTLDRTPDLADKRSSIKSVHIAAKLGNLDVLKNLIENYDYLMEALDSNGSSPLNSASSVGKLSSVELLINSGANKESKNNFGFTPLLSAAKSGFPEVVRLLITKGADLKAKDTSGQMAIHLAALWGHTNVVLVLLEASKSLLEQVNDAGQTPLFCAATTGQENSITFLIARGANIEARDSQSFTPLIFASASGYLLSVESLLRNGADARAVVMDRTQERDTAIHVAARRGQVGVISHLVSAYSDIRDLQNGKNNTPICVASLSAQFAAIERLLAEGASIESTCQFLSTPLILAAVSNKPEVVEFLLEKGANAMARSGATPEGDTAVHLAAYSGISPVVTKLLGFDSKIVEATNLLGQTPLWKAASGGKVEVAADLINHGASVDATDLLHRTPLVAAISSNQASIVKLLLEKGANATVWVNEQGFSGMSPIIYAAKLGFANVINALLDKYPELIEQTPLPSGNTALFMASAEGRLEVVETLLSRGARTEARGEFNRTPLLAAAVAGHSRVVKALIDGHCDIWYRSSEENLNTAAHLAAKFNNIAVLTVLLETEISLMESDNQDGYTPLWVAAENGMKEAVELLIAHGANNNPQGRFGFSPFLAAAATNRVAVLEKMQQLGVDVFSKSNAEQGENSALHLAAANGHIEIVQFFIKNAPLLISAVNKFGDTALIVASYTNQFKVVELLRNANAALETRGQYGRTAFLAAAVAGSVDVLRYLHQQKVNTSATGSCNGDEECAAIHLSAIHGSTVAVNYLLSERLDSTESRTNRENTPLWLAAYSGKAETVNFLIDKNADLEGLGRYGWSPVLAATVAGVLPVVQLLKQRGANILARSSELSRRNTAMHLAMMHGHVSIANFLLKDNPEFLESRNSLGWTPLHSTAGFGQVKAFVFLKDIGALLGTKTNALDGGNSVLHLAAIFDKESILGPIIQAQPALLEMTNDNGETALWRAASLGNKASVQTLIKLGAKVNVQCPFGWSPLGASAAKNRVQTAKELLAGGADVGVRTASDGNTPVHLAALYDRTGILHVFADRKANFEDGNVNKETPLWLAAYGGASNAVNYFLKRRQNMEVKGRNDWTPLHAAAVNGHVVVIRNLIEKGAALDVRSARADLYSLPLHLAASNGYSEVATALVESNSDLLNAVDGNNLTALSRAAFAGRENVVDALFQIDAKLPLSQKQDIRVPFLNAAARGLPEVLRIFVSYYPDVLRNARSDGDQFLAIHIAAKLGQDSSISFLLDKDVTLVNAKDRFNNTPLVLSAYEGRLSTVQLLVARRAAVDTPGMSSWTALMAASSRNHLQIVEFLMKQAKANVLAKSDLPSGGNTVAHIAVINNCKEVVESIVNFESSLLEIPNNDGNTPLYLASQYGFNDIVEGLLARGASNKAVGQFGYTPLVAAIMKNHSAVVKTLLDHVGDRDASVNIVDMFHGAAATGAVNVVSTLLEAKPDLLNAVDGSGNTALIKASVAGHTKVVSFLLNHGADLNIANKEQLTALTLAVKAGQIGSLSEIVNSGKLNINSRDSLGRTPLQWTVYLGNLPASQILVERGADLNDRIIDKENAGTCPIHLAALLGHLSLVRYFLEKRADLLDARSDSMQTPLLYAVRKGQVEIVRFLLMKRADPELRDADGHTPLMTAVAFNQLEVVKILVEGNADVLAKDNDGNSPLHLATINGYLSIVEYLASRGSRIVKNNKGCTPLWLASSVGNVKVVEILSCEKSEINIADNFGRTPLYAAATAGHTGVIGVLVSKGANVTIKSSEGDNSELPIHAAVRSKNLQAISEFLKADGKIQLETSNKAGDTPLCLAVDLGLQRVILSFISVGINVDARCARGLTPLMVAANRNKLKLVRIFHEHGANIAAKDGNGENAVHVAARAGSIKVLRMLLNLQPSVAEEANSIGETPLIIAASKGNTDAVIFLLNLGANVEAAIHGCTALCVAAATGQQEVVKILIRAGAIVDTWSDNGRTPLLDAAARCDLSMVKTLVDSGADATAKSRESVENGSSIIHLVVLNDCADVCKYLVDLRPDLLNSKNSEGLVARNFVETSARASVCLENKTEQQFLIAAKLGNRNMVIKLLKTGVNILSRRSSYEGGDTALHLTASVHVANVLIKQKPDFVRVTSRYGDTPLHTAALLGKKAVADLLLKSGADLEAKGRYGWTPFLASVSGGKADTFDFLIRKGANVKAVDLEGDSAIHLAARFGRDNLVRELMRRNVSNFGQRNLRNETAMWIAARFGRINVVIALAELNAPLEDQDENKVTPLLVAATYGHLEVVVNLLEMDVSIKARASKKLDGNYAIHFAARNGYIDIIADLVGRNPSLVNQKNLLGETALHIAAYVGDVAVVESLLSVHQADYNIYCRNHLTPLLTAITRNRVGVVKLMLDLGIETSVPSKNNERDLGIHIAAFYGHLEILQLLITNIEVDVHNAKGQTPLWKAASNGKVKAIELLLQRRADVNALDNSGVSPLEIATINGHFGVVGVLIAKMPQELLISLPIHNAIAYGHRELVVYFLQLNPTLLGELNEKGETPVWVAARYGKADIFAFLVSQGSDINLPNAIGETPLHVASSSGQTAIVQLLLKNKADVSAKTKDSQQNLAVHLAAAKGHVDVLRTLLNARSDLVDAKNANGVTPLWLASQHGNTKAMELLIKLNASVEATGQHGWTPFLVAVAGNHSEAVKLLITNKANILAKSNQQHNSNSAIHLAARFGHISMAKYLLHRVPKFLKLKNGNGNTALWTAAAAGHVDMVKMLHDLKADINIRGLGSMTPFLAAANNNHPDVLGYLLDVGANWKDKTLDASKNTAIHLAAGFGHLETVRYLAEKDPELLETLNGLGESPLWKASYGGHTAVMDFLIQRGASAEMRNRDGLTPLHAAIIAGKTGAVLFLINKGPDMVQAVTSLAYGQQTAMHLAAIRDMTDVMDVLIELRPELLEKRNANGETPLYLASYLGNLLSVQFLLKKRAQIEAQCKSGWTPLLAAAAHNRVGVMKIFIDQGSKLDQTTRGDGEENDALQLAALFGHEEMVRLISSVNLLTDRRNKLGETAIWKAAFAGQLGVLQYLVNTSCCRLDSRGRNKWKPLEAAAASGHLHVVSFLTELPDLGMRISSDFLPALQAATLNDQREVMELLREKIGTTIEIPTTTVVTAPLVSSFFARSEACPALLTAVESGHLEEVKRLTTKQADSLLECANENGETAVHLAAANNKLDIITHLVTVKPEVLSALDSNSRSPLWVASFNGHITVVKFLVKQKSNVESADKNGWTPLIAATFSGHALIVGYLVKYGKADLSARTNSEDGRNNVLHVACMNDNIKIAKYLFTRKMELTNEINSQGNTPIWLAAYYGSKQIVTFLLSRGVNIDSVGNFGWTPLMAAASQNRLEVVQLLVDAGASVAWRSRDSRNETVIHIASSAGFVNVVDYLLQKHRGFLLDVTDSNGETPLMRAVSSGHQGVVELLIRQRANLNTKARNGMTPLIRAIKLAHTSLVDVLLKENIDKDTIGGDGHTALMLAVVQGSTEFVSALLNSGADLRHRSTNENDHGGQAIHLAAASGQSAIVGLLLDTDSSLLEQKNDLGETPLICATVNKHVTTVELLLSRSADVNAKNAKGQTAVLLAVSSDNSNLATILINRGNIIDTKDSDGNTILHLAAKGGFSGAVKMIFDRARNLLEMTNNEGQTPLWLAASGGDDETVNLLLSFGAQADRADKTGRTPFMAASSEGKVECMRVLQSKGASVLAKTFGNELMAIHYAALNGQLPAVQFLVTLNSKAQLEATTSDGDTPLLLAASSGSDQSDRVIRYLLEQGAKIEARNKRYWTPLIAAAFNNKQQAARTLIEAGADINAQLDKLGLQNKAIHVAAGKGSLDVVKYLLDVKGDLLEAQNLQGATPLSEAAYTGQAQVIEYLIESGAAVDKPNHLKSTPLWQAVNANRSNVITTLVRGGANIEQPYTNGRTPLIHAAAIGNVDVVNVLIKNGANPRATNPRESSFTPLHMAVKLGKVDVVRYLKQVDKKLLEIRSAEGLTPYELALLDSKADIAALLSN